MLLYNITAAGAVDRELLYIELGDLFPPHQQQQQQQQQEEEEEQKQTTAVTNIDLHFIIPDLLVFWLTH